MYVLFFNVHMETITTKDLNELEAKIGWHSWNELYEWLISLLIEKWLYNPNNKLDENNSL